MTDKKSGAVRAAADEEALPVETRTEAKMSRAAQERAAKAQTVQAAEKAASGGTGWVVAPEESIVTPRGVLAGGTPIGPLDFVKYASQEEEGKRRLQAMASKKYVVRVA